MTYTLAVDTETKGFDWWREEEQAFIATTFDGTDERCFDLSDFAQSNALRQQVLAAEALVFHNQKFDSHQLRWTIDFDIMAEFDGEIYDTDLMARVYAPEGKWQEHGGFGLEALTKHFLGRDGKEGKAAMQEVAKSLGLTTMNKTGAFYQCWIAAPDVVERYAKLDARDTYDLFHTLNALPVTGGQRRIYDLERSVLPILIEAEHRGTAVNPTAVKRLHKKYLREQKRLHDSLVLKLGEKALGGEGSEQALIDAFLSHGVPLTERTENSNELSTAKYVLDKLVHDHPVVGEYQEYRHVNKFLSTYVERLIDQDVVHPSFQPIGAWTGRMACRNPNMQNIPVRSGPEVREVFVPREGNTLIVCDFDNIEVRILAYYLGPLGQPFRDLINSGLDAHGWMASELANRGIAPWCNATKIDQDSPPAIWTQADFAKDDVNGKLRAQAKNKVLFPILYGAGGGKLCQENGLPTGPPLKATDWLVKKGYKQVGEPSNKAGQELAKAVKDAIPGYKKLMYRVQDKIKDEGHVTTIGGRKQAVDPEKAYVGMSALVQGSAADIMKAALVKVNAAVLDDVTKLLLVVHDEVVVEAPTELAPAAAATIAHAMESAWPTLDPPLVVSTALAQNYGAAK